MVCDNCGYESAIESDFSECDECELGICTACDENGLCGECADAIGEEEE